MTPEEILSHSPVVLSQADREFYFDQGYLCVEKLIPEETRSELAQLCQLFVEKSGQETSSGDTFDIAPGHTREAPRLRRLKMPDVQHKRYWEFATGVIADVAADLVGPNVVFHHSKLNFKWNDGQDHVQWHQDIQFYPHTNYNVLTIGLYLNDTSVKNGALAVIPKSHEGPLFDQYNDKDQWVGCLSPQDIEDQGLAEKALYLEAPAGSITVHNCRTIHGSPASQAADGRPLLLNAYAAADAFPYTANASHSARSGALIRGKRARWAHVDPRPCLIPPDWSAGYTSIYALQAEEGVSASS